MINVSLAVADALQLSAWGRFDIVRLLSGGHALRQIETFELKD